MLPWREEGGRGQQWLPKMSRRWRIWLLTIQTGRWRTLRPSTLSPVAPPGSLSGRQAWKASPPSEGPSWLWPQQKSVRRGHRSFWITLPWMRLAGACLRIILFLDKKMFVVNPIVNRRNNRFLLKSRDVEVQAVHTTKHPAGVMTFGLVASDGNDGNDSDCFSIIGTAWYRACQKWRIQKAFSAWCCPPLFVCLLLGSLLRIGALAEGRSNPGLGLFLPQLSGKHLKA